MSIEELIAEELTKDTVQDAASEPIQVALDAEGEFVVVEAPAQARHIRRELRPN